MSCRFIFRKVLTTSKTTLCNGGNTFVVENSLQSHFNAFLAYFTKMLNKFIKGSIGTV